jgi:hypothetical protein
VLIPGEIEVCLRGDGNSCHVPTPTEFRLQSTPRRQIDKVATHPGEMGAAVAACLVSRGDRMDYALVNC